MKRSLKKDEIGSMLHEYKEGSIFDHLGIYDRALSFQIEVKLTLEDLAGWAAMYVYGYRQENKNFVINDVSFNTITKEQVIEFAIKGIPKIGENGAAKKMRINGGNEEMDKCYSDAIDWVKNNFPFLDKENKSNDI